MIAIKYQLFLLNPGAEKQDMLSAVDPSFTSPSAVEAVLSTLKFEDYKPLIVVGSDEDIEELVKNVERLDTTDWLDFDADERLAALIEAADELELEHMTELPHDSQQVFSDEEEVTAKKKFDYPTDLPHGNYDLWDAVKHSPDYKESFKIIKAAKKDKDAIFVEAHYRNAYEMFCDTLKRSPWNEVTEIDQQQRRRWLKGALIQGEEKAGALIKKMEDHLLHAGLIHKARASRFKDVVLERQTSLYVMCHEVPWALKPGIHSWAKVVKFLIEEFPSNVFHQTSTKLTSPIDQFTTVELHYEGESKLSVRICHSLTANDAGKLTRSPNPVLVQKRLEKIMTLWHKSTSGKFPDIDQFKHQV